MSKQIPLGALGRVEEDVKFEFTLASWRSELPPVLSTPHMIGLMEWAAFEAMKVYLDPGEISVGTAINIVHRAPAMVGTKITAQAELESFDGRFYVFRVSAQAQNGNEAYKIGDGTVTRAIVNHEEMTERLRKK